MSAKLRLGTYEYRENHPSRLSIFNSNYDQHGQKVMERRYPWRVQQGYTILDGGGFPSHEDATDFVREHLNTQAVS